MLEKIHQFFKEIGYKIVFEYCVTFCVALLGVIWVWLDKTMYNTFGTFSIAIGAIYFFAFALLLKMLIKISKEETETKKITSQYDSDIKTQINIIGLQIIEGVKDKDTGITSMNWLASSTKNQSDEIKERIKILNPHIKNISEDDIDNFKDLYDRIFYTLAPKEIKKLLLKAMQNIDKIAKDVVLFLVTLDEKGLEILKKQLKYVCNFLHKNNDEESNDYAIPGLEYGNYSLIQTELCKVGCIDLASYTMYHQQLWVYNRASIITNCNKINNIDSKNIYSVKINKKIQDDLQTEINIQHYACLNSMGVKIYRLLQDQLEQVPLDFLEKIIEFWNIDILQYQFILIKNDTYNQAQKDFKKLALPIK